MTIFRWPNGSNNIPVVTSEWNPARKNPVTGIVSRHNGIDLIGFPVNRSCASGVVTFARYNGGGGNEVRVLHPDGSESRYLHNAKLLVSVGQRVAQGSPLGIQGTTGQSTGIHLHFETRYGVGQASVNPRLFMRKQMAKPTPLIRKKDIDMKLIVRVNSGPNEWMLKHPSLVGPTPLERGYIVTTDPERAFIWGRDWATGGGTADNLGAKPGESNRDNYIAHQEEARLLREAWLRGQPQTANTEATLSIDLDDLAGKLAALIEKPEEINLDLLAQKVADVLAERMAD